MENIGRAIKKVERWSNNWGFKMSESKSCKFKYLGLWFDSKYTWKRHIKQEETKCKKVLNLLRAVAGCNWGADKQALIDMYRSIMRSHMVV